MPFYIEHGEISRKNNRCGKPCRSGTSLTIMMQSFHSYETRLYNNRLAAPGEAVFATPGDTASPRMLAEVSRRLQLNTLLFARPAEPFQTIINYLAQTEKEVIRPDDSESRTFLRDIPVSGDFSADAAAKMLSDAKCLIIPAQGIAATGKSGPKEAYIHFSAVCFACFVKFFSDFLTDTRLKRTTQEQKNAFSRAVKNLPPPPGFDEGLVPGPFASREKICAAMSEAGEKMVSMGMVDACFGNISWLFRDRLYISKSGSFLDALEGEIAECPIEDPACSGQHPSSEFPAHREIVGKNGIRGVLHGHPLFSVIMSMDCRIDCDHRGECHRMCPRERYLTDIPIVSGEVGGGAFGLSATVPRAIRRGRGVIVYGHGVFTAAEKDFSAALARMAEIEKTCRRHYFDRVKGL